jgi:predicted ATPase
VYQLAARHVRASSVELRADADVPVNTEAQLPETGWEVAQPRSTVQDHLAYDQAQGSGDVMLLETIRADGILSFAPGSPDIPLQELNLIIGPNGSGKSNLVEIIELLHALPASLSSAIRDGGGAREWPWKGDGGRPAALEARLHRAGETPLRYRVGLVPYGNQMEVVREILDEATNDGQDDEPYFHYRFDGGDPILRTQRRSLLKSTRPIRDLANNLVSELVLRQGSWVSNESILSQRKDPDLYPDLTWCATQFGRIQTFREWTFGRYAALRQPQPADLPTDVLLSDARNLGLILNQLEHSDSSVQLNTMLQRFLPRFKRVTTLVQGGTVQIFLHEDGVKTPIPATRLSDGTMRFLAMAALLLMPTPPPLICIDEPELGLHPDALALVAELLVSARERTQLIVTTHSDALVSALTDHVESVLVCEYRLGTQLTRLDAARLQYWLDKYRLGDLWRMGELGGNP